MRNIALTAIIAMGTVAAYTSSDPLLRFLQQAATNLDAPPPLAYDVTLKCDQCIRSGYVFCLNGQERTDVPLGETPPPGKCCQDATCAEASDSAWTCSSSYSDPILARAICPFPRGQCGNNS